MSSGSSERTKDPLRELRQTLARDFTVRIYIHLYVTEYEKRGLIGKMFLLRYRPNEANGSYFTKTVFFLHSNYLRPFSNLRAKFCGSVMLVSTRGRRFKMSTFLT